MALLLTVKKDLELNKQWQYKKIHKNILIHFADTFLPNKHHFISTF